MRDLKDQRVKLIGHLFRGFHRGQRSHDRVRKAGHMTAPFPSGEAPEKSLAQRAVPHMGGSGHLVLARSGFKACDRQLPLIADGRVSARMHRSM
jgi:hypothetical protein